MLPAKPQELRALAGGARRRCGGSAEALKASEVSLGGTSFISFVITTLVEFCDKAVAALWIGYDEATRLRSRFQTPRPAATMGACEQVIENRR